MVPDLKCINASINPNDNDEEEFSDGIGDEQMEVTKVELYDDETNKLLETNQVKN